MFLAAVAIRGVALALDSRPRFFFGDSESYLYTAFGRWIPPDRSWLYGLAVNALLHVTHHLVALIAVQAALSAAACAATAALLRSLGGRPWVAWTALLLHSADPLLHYYDRSVLTDAPGAAAVWLGIVLVVTGLVRCGWWPWVAACPFLWLAITLRTALLPLVMLASAYALVVRMATVAREWRDQASLPWSTRLRPLAGPAALAAAVACGVTVYAVATGKAVGSTPALNPKSGYFLLAQVAPILAPVDFNGLGISDPDGLLRDTRHQEFALRDWQHYAEQGLALRMERELGDWRRTSEAGRQLARRSIQRDPFGFARLGLATARDYLALALDEAGFRSGLGLDRPLPDGMVVDLHAKVWDDIEPEAVARTSLVLNAMRGWSHALPLMCWLALLLPVAVALGPHPCVSPGRVAVPLLWACCWTYAAFLFAFSTGYLQRYLLPFSPLLLCLLGVWMERWLRRREERPLIATA